MKFPEVIAEIGINHDGDFDRAVKLVEAAHHTGVKCVKFQCHVVEDEMIPNEVIPPNAKESIYAMMKRCSFSEEQDRTLKNIVEGLGMQYLSTPFSRAAADRLERMGVTMYKIGSGECNNYPLIRHINSFGKPIILSTGMNGANSIKKAVDLLTVPFALLHCVSMYPAPYERVNLWRIDDLRVQFPGVPVGLSDHSLGIYTALGAIGMGADVVEKHFTLDRSWSGADNKISILPGELMQLVRGNDAIRQALTSLKKPKDEGVRAFAFASVVSTKDIQKGDELTVNNIWVKRPGGGIPAADYENLLGKVALCDIPKDRQLSYEMVA